ncbi:unnamed protein product [Durusdinium trenchii]|uniref:Uncharacterized protein n=1 Tax=Durusdinium trenchii TaxID=1381693 RepID=A0ABP0QSG9_9DINO
MNFHTLRPIIQHYPYPVPSGYFLTDCILRLDELFDEKMLVGGSSKLQLAAEEGVKLKKLCGAVESSDEEQPDPEESGSDIGEPHDDDEVPEGDGEPAEEDVVAAETSSESTTLRLPGYSRSGESSDSDVVMEAKEADSQRPGAWMSEAYLEFSTRDQAENAVVPAELLYTWWRAGRPSGDKFKNTFSKDDLRCQGVC